MGAAMTIPPLPVSAESPTPARKAPSWWRRNLIALVALVVLLPVTAAAVGWQEWYQFFGFGTRAVSAVVVADGETADLAGATWGPLRGGEVQDISGLDVPDGARLLAVAVPVDASTAAVACALPTLVEQKTGREWRPVATEIGYFPGADEPQTCLSGETGAYDLVVPFVVPDDAEGPFWVDVMPYDAGGSFLRFSFEP